jgi:hypothetical protein
MAKSNWPDASLQLNVTVLATKEGEGSCFTPLTNAKQERDAVIHALIEKFNGVQDPGLGGGVVIIPLLDMSEEGPSVELWIHDWE